MILSNYNFSYYSDEETFLQENKDILEKINGMKIQEVYALWNNIDGSWFLDGPMLIQFEQGILSVKVKSEKDIAIGWNDIDLNSKPIWLSQNEIPGWEADLRTVYIQIFTLFKFDKNLKKYNRKTTLFIVK